MHFLVTNDDGVYAAGLLALAQELRKLGEVSILAPDHNWSASGHVKTLSRPLRVKPATLAAGTTARCSDGAPSDCVGLAVMGVIEKPIDMVVSGINAGANMGDDVLYSGTVAAAIEGRSLGYPAMAISLMGEACQHYACAARVAAQLIQRLAHTPLPADTILNVNVPDIPFEELEGYEATRLGRRHRAEGVICSRDPRGLPIYWIGPAGGEADAGPGTDFHAVAHKRVSITPVQVDLTQYTGIDTVGQWLTGLNR
jgi:5'-nucleotidase